MYNVLAKKVGKEARVTHVVTEFVEGDVSITLHASAKQATEWVARLIQENTNLDETEAQEQAQEMGNDGTYDADDWAVTVCAVGT